MNGPDPDPTPVLKDTTSSTLKLGSKRASQITTGQNNDITNTSRSQTLMRKAGRGTIMLTEEQMLELRLKQAKLQEQKRDMQYKKTLMLFTRSKQKRDRAK